MIGFRLVFLFLGLAADPDTGYDTPSEIVFRWAGPSLVAGTHGTVNATLKVDVGGPSPAGLIEKVDVLAEIPYVVKTVVNYVAGTKPYIYQVRQVTMMHSKYSDKDILLQWMNGVKLSVSGPDALIPGLSGGLEIEGILYNEATFIS